MNVEPNWLGRYPKNTKMDDHEEAHRRLYERLGLGYLIVHRPGTGPVVAADLSPWAGKEKMRRYAVTLWAGYKAGGGDAKGDKKAALELAAEVGMTEAELNAMWRKYR